MATGSSRLGPGQDFGTTFLGVLHVYGNFHLEKELDAARRSLSFRKKNGAKLNRLAVLCHQNPRYSLIFDILYPFDHPLIHCVGPTFLEVAMAMASSFPSNQAIVVGGGLGGGSDPTKSPPTVGGVGGLPEMCEDV